MWLTRSYSTQQNFFFLPHFNNLRCIKYQNTLYNKTKLFCLIAKQENECCHLIELITFHKSFVLFVFPLIIFYFCSNVMRILEWIVTPQDANYGGFCPLYFCKSQSGVYILLEAGGRRTEARSQSR